MSGISRRIFSVLLALFLLGSTTTSAQVNDLTTRLQAIRTGVQQSLDQLRKALAQPNPTPTERDLPNASLFILITGGDPNEAEDYLNRAFAEQNMDTQSPQYGQVPWQIGHPEIVDGNADEFTNQAIGPILLGYKDRLSANFLDQLRPHLVASLAVLEHRVVSVSYTNIYLMQTIDLLLIGQAMNDSTAITEGSQHLDNWLSYTAQNGVHEYDSPTYYGTDLDSLMQGYLYTSDPTIKAKLKGVLDYFWTDLAANYFAGRQSLSGPHSRDYDFLAGAGGIDLYYYVEGIIPDLTFGALDFEKTFLLEQGQPNAYHPDSSILALAQQSPRWIMQRYGDQADMDRTNFITPDFAIGGASGNYDAQDKLISVELAGGKALPAITIVPDEYDAPWGKLNETDPGGHSKPHHLPLSPLSVQDQGDLLTLLNLNLSSKAADSDLGTNLILPAQADQISVNGQPVTVSKPFKETIDAGSTIGVLKGQGAVAIRFFHWQDCGANGQTVLQADKVSLRYRALRLTRYQDCQGVSGKTAPRLDVGVLLVARHVENTAQFQQLVADVQQAPIMDKTAGPVWSVSATIDGKTLAISRRATSGTLISRTINSAPVTFPTLAINGTSVTLGEH